MAQQGSKSSRQWYTTSVDTLRAWGIVALLVVLGVVGFFGYRAWERYALRRDAELVIDESRVLIQRLQYGVGAGSFRSEYAAAWENLREARGHFGEARYAEALASGQRSRALLQSILDALRYQGRGGEAQFIALQGGVEFRRGERGQWEEARARVVLESGDYVKTSGNGSAEVMFLDGTLYTVRPNTLLLISRTSSAPGSDGQQAIAMEYGWVNLNTSKSSSTVSTPRAAARVREDSEATVSYDQRTDEGRFAAYRGSVEVKSSGGEVQELGGLEQVVQRGGTLSAPASLPERPDALEPRDNVEVNFDAVQQLVLGWEPVAAAGRYALQVSRNRLFVDNLIDVENRLATRATLGLRGEGTFQWRVAAVNREGLRGPWSGAQRFRVASFAGRGGDLDQTPPKLELEAVRSYGSIFIISGRTEPGASLAINGEVVAVAADGGFNKTVQLEQDGWDFVEIKASDSAGNEEVSRRRVFVYNF